jgi:uncharacterized protein (DUF488 family)
MSNTIQLFTIGFTKSTAEHFFDRLQSAGVKKVIDVRLWPSTQLAGFAKQNDLSFFLKTIAGIEYEHHPWLAPTAEILKNYRDKKIMWAEYEKLYLNLLNLRNTSEKAKLMDLNKSCFLCAEDTPNKCHRRLLAEYLQKNWDDVEIVHL